MRVRVRVRVRVHTPFVPDELPHVEPLWVRGRDVQIRERLVIVTQCLGLRTRTCVCEKFFENKKGGWGVIRERLVLVTQSLGLRGCVYVGACVGVAVGVLFWSLWS